MKSVIHKRAGLHGGFTQLDDALGLDEGLPFPKDSNNSARNIYMLCLSFSGYPKKTTCAKTLPKIFTVLIIK